MPQFRYHVQGQRQEEKFKYLPKDKTPYHLLCAPIRRIAYYPSRLLRPSFLARQESTINHAAYLDPW